MPLELAIVQLDSELHTFEVLALKYMEEEAQEMVNYDVQDFVVASATSPLAAPPRNPRTEKTMEEEEIPTETYYSSNYNNPPPKTPTHPMSLP